MTDTELRCASVLAHVPTFNRRFTHGSMIHYNVRLTIDESTMEPSIVIVEMTGPDVFPPWERNYVPQGKPLKFKIEMTQE